MDSPNSADCNKRIWVEATDSAVLNTGFVEFVKSYQRRCTDDSGVEPKLEAEEHKSETSAAEPSIKSSSLNTIGLVPTISHTKPGVDDAGFNRFLDEWSANITTKARVEWNKMSKKDRAFYERTDDLSRASEVKRACDKVCSNLLKSRFCKPKCKGKNSKPLGTKRCPKVNCRRCPKPKSDKKCRKPKESSIRSDFDSAPKGDKECRNAETRVPETVTK